MKFTALYVRVSTFEQNEASQIAVIEKWLEGNGILPESLRWYIDKGRSGDNLVRPEFDRLTGDIFLGQIETVVTYKLDRVSRNLRDGVNTICDWCDRGLRIVSVTQQIDFNGIVGKMLAAILFAIAESEQDTRRDRQAAGIAVAKANGKYKGRAKGWRKGNPERAKQLKAMGLSYHEIAVILGVSRAAAINYVTDYAKKRAQKCLPQNASQVPLETPPEPTTNSAPA